MARARELIKRTIPPALRQAFISAREKLAAPPLEDIVMHGYQLVVDPDPRPRLSLVIPSVNPASAFGGVTTGLDVFLALCRRSGADGRIIVDDFEQRTDRSVVDRRAGALGIAPESIEIVARAGDTPAIPVRARDIFLTYNWWITLNIRSLLDEQVRAFGGALRPFIYLIQDYEPLFYKFSSTHMLARLACDPGRPYWGVFNSSQLHEFFVAQGHKPERDFVFEPQISPALRGALDTGPIAKAKRILVYGRPQIPRNCFPAVEKGLRLWAQGYPQFADWDVVSAGLAHDPIRIGPGRALRSLGKLPLDGYADLLRTTGVGLSLMSSPHPSYPPLEMAHFGLLTVTNRYANKDLGRAHDNIISIPDIDAPTIAAALAQACARFEGDPDAGWRARSHIPSYLDTAEWSFVTDLSNGLREVWVK